MNNVKGPNATVTFSGIKCDNPDCNYADLTVNVEEYDQWLNRPCPDCGCNLLTQADYDMVKMILYRANEINKMEHDPSTPVVRAYGHFNGTGRVDFSIDSENENEE